jgi:MYXO-CTERM domain-containing protein
VALRSRSLEVASRGVLAVLSLALILGAPLTIVAMVGCYDPSGLGPDPADTLPSIDEDTASTQEAACGPASGTWSDFPYGNGKLQCVGGVRQFYDVKFNAYVPPASGGPVGACAKWGACNIRVNPANRPSPAVWNRYKWGTATAHTYDQVDSDGDGKGDACDAPPLPTVPTAPSAPTGVNTAGGCSIAIGQSDSPAPWLVLLGLGLGLTARRRRR